MSRLVPTVLNFDRSPAPSSWTERSRPSSILSTARGSSRALGMQNDDPELSERSTVLDALPSVEPDDDGELKLPKMRSLVIMIFTNVMLQTTFFIIVSSGSKYAEYLGGSETFSGLVIGIPTVFSGIALVPLVRHDGGRYKFALHLSCAAAVAGSILYAMAYKAHFLYLILIGRIVMGVSFAQFLYTKRYCSDPRIVGIRRRTTLAGWLVVGQSMGFTVGPFAGGLLYKVGFANPVFNGYTSPGWLMALVWVVFWVVVTFWFEDVPRSDALPSHADSKSQSPSIQQHTPSPRASSEGGIPMETLRARSSSLPRPPSPTAHSPMPPAENMEPPPEHVSPRQWAVAATMCWFAMTCFFVLGAWEANIPIYAARAFGASPFVAGNLIALGGVCTFPFMFANVLLARRVQDRYILAAGCALGLLGLLLTLGIVNAGRTAFATLFACWFFVALGFNLASTVTLSLLSKQMPQSWNGKMSLFIQYSNFSGRVSGGIWGGAGVGLGMNTYVGMQLAFLGIGALMFMTLWREMKAKTG